MKTIITLKEALGAKASMVGGKASALARLDEAGVVVPRTLCITVRAYERFLKATGLRELILMELARKSFDEMRWEEIWDASLRIRNYFAREPLGAALERELSETIGEAFGDALLAIRSSAPEEDSKARSFAGLHESFIGVKGAVAAIEHIRLVWASLWSDAALLYRREFGLDIERSAMAVVVQELVEGEKSGVAFSENPLEGAQAVIEAVRGLNEALVDGGTEPDRWILSKKEGEVLSYIPAARGELAEAEGIAGKQAGSTAEAGGTTEPPGPVLSPGEVRRVFSLCRNNARIFQKEQDVEWTLKGPSLVCLQSRPITAAPQAEGDDKRPWYLSLKRSFENLKRLRWIIEEHILPSMSGDADALAGVILLSHDDGTLADELDRRQALLEKWTATYWDELIPFAHGMRLFGQFYNDRVKPGDAHEFMALLTDTTLISTDRNRELMEMARLVRESGREAALESLDRIEGLSERFEAFLGRFSFLFCKTPWCSEGRQEVWELITRLASSPLKEKARHPDGAGREALEQRFLEALHGDEKTFALELLDLARASYRLRDDDNLYLERISYELDRALQEGRRRLGAAGDYEPLEIAAALRGAPLPEKSSPGVPEKEPKPVMIARQLVGQPAGPGLGRGRARVIHGRPDLSSFQSGEVLVCDALDPSLTIIIPLAAAIVERRGGMLIHGAIIAREYGIPCVTGVPGATEAISTGDDVTVDGHLGIVIINRAHS
ncbi:MAG: PEP/pyruvate-binding domain-containing protein [Candidatus Eremiobacteraeota bacterium]|nr:PEP/pyruvate-binding domain-containing protein [Candidatus Eremiobacteraeota bacterium]